MTPAELDAALAELAKLDASIAASGETPIVTPTLPLGAMCDICHLEIGEAEYLPKTQRFRGETVYIHSGCWENYEAEKAIRIREQDADAAAERRRQQQERLTARVGTVLAQFPVWEGARIDNPEFTSKLDPRLLKFARNWRPQFGSVGIFGDTGAGKTMICSAMMRQWGAKIIEAGTPDPLFFGAVWAKSYRVVDSLKWHKLGVGEPPELTRARKATVLFFDDLGQEASGTEHTVFGLLDERYELGKPTIITSGLRIGEVAARYGQHLGRRFTEKGSGNPLDLFPAKKLEVVK